MQIQVAGVYSLAGGLISYSTARQATSIEFINAKSNIAKAEAVKSWAEYLKESAKSRQSAILSVSTLGVVFIFAAMFFFYNKDNTGSSLGVFFTGVALMTGVYAMYKLPNSLFE